MKTIRQQLGPIQNVGLGDRSIRIVVGMLMLLGSMLFIQNGEMQSWHAYLMLASVYPLMTGLLGWCPLYALSHLKSCSSRGRNQCGTLPYQVDAAMGHKPKTDHDYDHSLIGSHH